LTHRPRARLWPPGLHHPLEFVHGLGRLRRIRCLPGLRPEGYRPSQEPSPSHLQPSVVRRAISHGILRDVRAELRVTSKREFHADLPNRLRLDPSSGRS
jgi:hypothetical protein